MTTPSTRKWVASKWWLAGLAATSLAMAVDVSLAELPAETIVADCFQRGFQPPPCSAASSAPTTASAVPDSGVNACQNQGAMATSIGLLPAVCPPTVGGG
jgi:hypothetical protein